MQIESKMSHASTHSTTGTLIQNMAQLTTSFRTTTPSTATTGRKTTKQINLVQVPQKCIYLTLNLELPGLPSGRNSYPLGRNSYPSGRNSYPSGRKMLQHARDFVRSEQLYQSLLQDKYRLIPLASVQLSIKLILSLSLVS